MWCGRTIHYSTSVRKGGFSLGRLTPPYTRGMRSSNLSRLTKLKTRAIIFSGDLQVCFLRRSSGLQPMLDWLPDHWPCRVERPALDIIETATWDQGIRLDKGTLDRVIEPFLTTKRGGSHTELATSPPTYPLPPEGRARSLAGPGARRQRRR
jgi:hypothetical protein